MRLIVTRPAPQAERWVAALAAHGVPAVALPLIAIEPPADPVPLQRAWLALHASRFVMFVSGNAVQQFFAFKPPGARWPATLRAGATGPGTAQALRDVGLSEAQVVQPAAGGTWDAEALWARIAGDGWAGAAVMVVRGEQGRDWLAQQWRAAGARVQFVEAYRRVAPSFDAAGRSLLADALAAPAAHRWLFSSSEAIGNLQRAAGPEAAAAWPMGRALATHPRIADSARRAGFGEVALCAPELAAVVEAWRTGCSSVRPDPSA